MVKRIIIKFCFFVLPFFLLVFHFTPYPIQAQNQSSSTDELIVRFQQSFSLEDRLKLHRQVGGSTVGKIDTLGVEIWQIEKEKVEEVLTRLHRNPNIAYAEPNYIATAFELTNDQGIINNLQWGMYKVKAADNEESAWNFSKSDSGVKIAILDTGIDQNHQDLSEKIIGNKNCTNSPTVDDLYGHGTHVAGIAAAATNNGLGVAGLGYKAKLLNGKALDDNGSGYYSWIADCIIWAADQGADVINLSLGGSNKSKMLEDAVNYAWNKGVVVVAAAGNSGSSQPIYPAYYSKVMAVAATDQSDQKASWSNYGSWVDVAAPGVSIYSTLPNHKNGFNKLNYGYLSGTSMATPHVTGLAALLFGSGNMDNAKVIRAITDYADRIYGTDLYWSYGRINAYRSVSAVRVVSITEPTISSSPTPSSIPVASSTPTVTPLPSSTPTPTVTPLPTATPTPTFTPTPTVTPIPTAVPIPSSRMKNPWLKVCQRFPQLCGQRFE